MLSKTVPYKTLPLHATLKINDRKPLKNNNYVTAFHYHRQDGITSRALYLVADSNELIRYMWEFKKSGSSLSASVWMYIEGPQSLFRKYLVSKATMCLL